MVCRSNFLKEVHCFHFYEMQWSGVGWAEAWEPVFVAGYAVVLLQGLDSLPSLICFLRALFLNLKEENVDSLSGGGLAVYSGYLPTHLSVFSMSAETCRECCWMSTGDEEESSRAGVSALSSILQSKFLVPPPGSFPKGEGGVLVKRRG